MTSKNFVGVVDLFLGLLDRKRIHQPDPALLKMHGRMDPLVGDPCLITWAAI